MNWFYTAMGVIAVMFIVCCVPLIVSTVIAF